MKNELLSQLKATPPLLVASLDGDDLPFLLEEARALRADVVEIRMDIWDNFFREDMLEKLERFKRKIGIPMLVSFRGGHPFPSWWQPLHWRALAHAAMIDVEWNPKYPWKLIQKNVQQLKLALMISHHDYKGTPALKVLSKIAKTAYGKKADVVKIATRVTDVDDVRMLLELNAALGPKRLSTVMGMGPLGTVSRLAAPLFGSCVIYGYIGTPTARGQLPYAELQERIRALYPGYEAGLQARQAKLVSPS